MLFKLKIISITILVILLVKFSYSNDSNGSFVFKIKEFRIVYNNHVGNDWSYWVEINYLGQKYKIFPFSNDKIKLKINKNEEIIIKAVAVEYDRYSDYGFKTIKLNTNKLFEDKDLILNFDIIVVEDRGRYAGNTAKLNCKLEIKEEN